MKKHLTLRLRRECMAKAMRGVLNWVRSAALALCDRMLVLNFAVHHIPLIFDYTLGSSG